MINKTHVHNKNYFICITLVDGSILKTVILDIGDAIFLRKPRLESNMFEPIILRGRGGGGRLK